MTSPQEDMRSRWRPSATQQRQAEDVLLGGAQVAYTLQFLVNKHFGIWNADVEVVALDGFVFGGEDTFESRNEALAALRSLTRAYALTHGKHVCGGYSRHVLGEGSPPARDVETIWAVWDDICSEFNEKGEPVR